MNKCIEKKCKTEFQINRRFLFARIPQNPRSGLHKYIVLVLRTIRLVCVFLR